MATTTNFGWTTPNDTDLVKDGAAAIRTLGSGIDTSFVDLKGGTTGQVLSKATNTDLDFTWVAQDDSNAIQNALLTTTGDTIYASSASTPARLGIGSSGQCLTVVAGVPSWAASATSVLTNTGDILYASAANTLARKAIGSTGDVLTVSGGIPTWVTPAGGSFVGVLAQKTGSQSISNNTTTKVTFNQTDVYDTDGFHDPATNSSRITIPTGKGGYYLIHGHMVWDANSSGRRLFKFTQNNTTDLRVMEGFSTATNTVYPGMHLITIVNLTAGDYVEMEVWQNTGGSLNIDGSTTWSQFGVVKLG